MKRFKPIKVFHINFGYGWWWGSTVFFTNCVIVPFWFVCENLEYASTGKSIGQGDCHSWSKERQEQKDK